MTTEEAIISCCKYLSRWDYPDIPQGLREPLETLLAEINRLQAERDMLKRQVSDGDFLLLKIPSDNVLAKMQEENDKTEIAAARDAAIIKGD